MNHKNLRLRLVVHRHSLPEVCLVFSIALDNDPTISKLIEQVNETVPLESKDWGLDDYVVELRDHKGSAFECLHFQAVREVLQQDEEVLIRPLFTEDRKKRLLGGREQISRDGKHLVDGVPFGRPRLKAPRGRPAINIPPLKRRRIIYDVDQDGGDDESESSGGEPRGEDEEADEDYHPMLLMENGEVADDPSSVGVSATFDDADSENGPGEDDSSDIDFRGGVDMDEVDDDEDEDVLEDLGDADLDSELADLRRENAQHNEPATVHASMKKSEGSLDLSALSKITALHVAFPQPDAGVLQTVLSQCKNSFVKAYRRLGRSHRPLMTLRQSQQYLQLLMAPTGRQDRQNGKGGDDQAWEGRDSENEDGVRDGDQSEVGSEDLLVKHYDEHGFPAGSIQAGTTATDLAQDLRDSGVNVKLPVHTIFGEEGEGSAPAPSAAESAVVEEESGRPDLSESDESSDSSSEESASESSGEDEEGSVHSQPSSHSDDDDDDDESGPEVASSKRPQLSGRDPGDGSSSSDADDSSVSSDEDTDGAGTGLERGTKDMRTTDTSGASVVELSSDSSSDSSVDSSSSSSESESEPEPGPETEDESASAPTASMRHRIEEPGGTAPEGAACSTTKSTTMQAVPKLVPPGHGLSKTRARNARRRAATKLKKLATAGLPDATSEATAFALQEAPQLPHDRSSASLAERKLALLSSLGTEDQRTADGEAGGEPYLSQQAETKPADVDVAASLAQPKSKLNVSASRRILFGALGLRNPKSKDDEDKIRAGLMKNVRPLTGSTSSRRAMETVDDAGVSGDRTDNTAEDEDPEAWRRKINYRAVECCYDGVEYSEPPFPYVQRWDPQQQGYWYDNHGHDNNKRGGRGKRKRRNHPEFYDGTGVASTKKQKCLDQYSGGPNGAADDGYGAATEGDVALDYDEVSQAEAEKSAADSQVTDMDDLPLPPQDLSTLPELRAGGAEPGMVITWKQLLLSRATNWQPTISSLTAVVLNADGPSSLRVSLARRDRNLDHNEKVFDEDGNRVYDRFEAPDFEDENSDEDRQDGVRTLDFSEMIEPRIVQQAPPNLDGLSEDHVANDAAKTGGRGRGPGEDAQGIGGRGRESSGEEPTEQDREAAAARSKAAAEQMGCNMADSNETVIPETLLSGGFQRQDSMAADIPTDSPAGIAISDGRRDEISLLISGSVFRKDVSPLILNRTPLDSPSEQLREMSQSVVAKEAEQARVPSISATSGTSPGGSAALSTTDADEIAANDLEPYGPGSAASSIGSGRQLEADFHMDWVDSIDPLHDATDVSVVTGSLSQKRGALAGDRILTEGHESSNSKPLNSASSISGSQVISLISSSPIAEHYADEAIPSTRCDRVASRRRTERGGVRSS